MRPLRFKPKVIGKFVIVQKSKVPVDKGRRTGFCVFNFSIVARADFNALVLLFDSVIKHTRSHKLKELFLINAMGDEVEALKIGRIKKAFGFKA